MTPGAEREPWARAPEGDAYVRDQLAAIDNDLLRGMPSDARLESGVPDGQRAGALDFIQMTGLTRPPLRPAAGAASSYAGAPLRSDLNPTAPLSFYEEGVSDVDERVNGGVLGSDLLDANLDSDLVPPRTSETLGIAPSRSVQALKDIIAELEAGVPSGSADRAPNLPEGDGADAIDLLGSIADALGPAPSASAAISAASAESDIFDAAAVPPVDLPLTVPPALLSPHADAAPPALDRPAVEAGPALPVEQEPPLDEEPLAAPESPVDAGQGMGTEFDALLASLEPDNNDTEPAENPDDWDALLDRVTPDAPPVAGPPARGGAGSGVLAEAEQLLNALGQKRRDAEEVSPQTKAPPLPPAPAVMPPEPLPALREEHAEAVVGYDYSAAPTRRRSRRHSRIARRGWRMIRLLAGFAVVVAGLVALWIYVLGPTLQKPRDLAASAERYMAEGRYTEASATYAELANRRSPESANAQFHSAYALTLASGLPPDAQRENNEKALTLFQAFVDENPQHPKRARALCLMGRLYFDMQDYDSAIAILRDQVKPVDDPAAALSILRYLARSYKWKGQYEEAETAYLQAATLPGSYSAETDYQELGEMFHMRASLAEDPAEQRRLEETAAAYWNRALQVPGVDPETLDRLQEQLEWQTFTRESTPGGPVAETDPAAAPVVAPPAPEAASPDLPPVDTGEHDADPAIEMESLIPSAGAADPAAGGGEVSDAAVTSEAPSAAETITAPVEAPPVAAAQ